MNPYKLDRRYIIFLARQSLDKILNNEVAGEGGSVMSVEGLPRGSWQFDVCLMSADDKMLWFHDISVLCHSLGVLVNEMLWMEKHNPLIISFRWICSARWPNYSKNFSHTFTFSGRRGASSLLPGFFKKRKSACSLIQEIQFEDIGKKRGRKATARWLKYFIIWTSLLALFMPSVCPLSR